jgi:3'(2'), 5'-bisphosphate nucleotidase
MLTESEIQSLLKLAREAGKAIMEVYNDPSGFDVETKDDNSPLTRADKASHDVISKGLKKLFPDIPILSEEGKDIPYNKRSSWESFWLVDPLDGTKEFIKRNDEFTVNIALIKDGYPDFGIVYLPAEDVIYYGGQSYESFKNILDETRTIRVRNNQQERIAMRSRSHASEEEQKVYEKHEVSSYKSAGSALKFCYVAEGAADLYYRHGPTMEWDSGAGQAVIEGAGGVVLYDQGPNRFSYNKRSLRNGPFLVLGFDQ